MATCLPQILGNNVNCEALYIVLTVLLPFSSKIFFGVKTAMKFDSFY
jgi:hypothetical protein